MLSHLPWNFAAPLRTPRVCSRAEPGHMNCDCHETSESDEMLCKDARVAIGRGFEYGSFPYGTASLKSRTEQVRFGRAKKQQEGGREKERRTSSRLQCRGIAGVSSVRHGRPARCDAAASLPPPSCYDTARGTARPPTAGESGGAGAAGRATRGGAPACGAGTAGAAAGVEVEPQPPHSAVSQQRPGPRAAAASSAAPVASPAARLARRQRRTSQQRDCSLP